MNPIQVLVVDDDEEDFLILKDLAQEIRPHSVKLSQAQSFEQAVELTKTQAFDVILLDYRLGGRTGLELFEELKAQGFKGPQILLTGMNDLAIDVQAMQLGVADYLIKGEITSALLDRSLRYALAQSRSFQYLQKREANFRNLVNSTREAIVIHEFSGKILDVNSAAEKFLNESRSKLLNRSLFDFMPSLRDSLHDLNENEHQNFELKGMRPDQSEWHAEVEVRPYWMDDQKVYLSLIHDTTTRRQMELQFVRHERLATAGLFASSLAHEIGTPLGVIRGRAEYIGMDSSLSDETRKNIQMIIDQIDRISKLIRSLLNLSRENSRPRVGSVIIKDISDSIYMLMSHEFKVKNIQFAMDIPQEAVVTADADGLQQVLINLLVNAVHAIDGFRAPKEFDKRRIHFSARLSGNNWILEVKDTGGGISKQNLSQIFKPFFTTKPIGSGTGLGLAVAFQFVTSWNGTLEVKSEEGEGTSFIIQIPQAKLSNSWVKVAAPKS